jgi:hypothetical protein
VCCALLLLLVAVSSVVAPIEEATPGADDLGAFASLGFLRLDVVLRAMFASPSFRFHL